MQVFAHKWHHTSNVMPYSFAAQLPSDVVVEPAVAGRLIGGPGVPRGPGAYAAIPRTPYIITAGHWDCSLRVFDFETGALRQSGTAHRAPVTCLSIATSAPPPAPSSPTLSAACQPVAAAGMGSLPARCVAVARAPVLFWKCV